MTILIIFGASGDLTSSKIIPALFSLFIQNKLPEDFHLLGIARSPWTSEQWRMKLKPLIEVKLNSTLEPNKSINFKNKTDFDTLWTAFAAKVDYLSGSVESAGLFIRLSEYIRQKKQKNGPIKVIYYLALTPDLCPTTIRNLERARLCKSNADFHFEIIMEKPFGYDYPSSVALNRLAHRSFNENQIFRIDHFLGKETVNNIFVLRFANSIFEPIWNRNYIDSIEITANESVTAGHRGPFYEKTGVLRDMFQNHLLQLLTITAMEPPVLFDAKSVRDEKVKVLRAVRRYKPEEIACNLVRGQYIGYQNESGVNPQSNVPTFAAVRLYIDNWRWKDVPFYLRSGKATSCRTTQIVIRYRKPPHLLFEKGEFKIPKTEANRLLIQLQPSEGIKLNFLAKIPGTQMRLKQEELTFSFANGYARDVDAYARLLLDAFSGNSFLFLRNDEIETAWEIIDPFQQFAESEDAGMPEPYQIGDWGPNRIKPLRHSWYDVCPILQPNRIADPTLSINSDS